MLPKFAPLWEHWIRKWAQMLCRGPDGRLYFLEKRELQWANHFLQVPLPKALTQALKYLIVLLSSKDPACWLSLCQKLIWSQGLDYPIAPRWQTMMDPDWGSLPDRPSPLAVERATKQLFI